MTCVFKYVCLIISSLHKVGNNPYSRNRESINHIGNNNLTTLKILDFVKRLYRE